MRFSVNGLSVRNSATSYEQAVHPLVSRHYRARQRVARGLETREETHRVALRRLRKEQSVIQCPTCAGGQK